MIAEHTFVTTVQAETVIQRVHDYLVLNKFKVTEVCENKISAVRGRQKPTHPKLELLPQIFEMTFDRGRVAIGLSAMLYQDKKRPVHAIWLTAFMNDLEQLLTKAEATLETCNQFTSIEHTHKRGWSTAGIFVATFLAIIFLAFVVIMCICIYRAGHH